MITNLTRNILICICFNEYKNNIRFPLGMDIWIPLWILIRNIKSISLQLDTFVHCIVHLYSECYIYWCL